MKQYQQCLAVKKSETHFLKRLQTNMEKNLFGFTTINMNRNNKTLRGVMLLKHFQYYFSYIVAEEKDQSKHCPSKLRVKLSINI